LKNGALFKLGKRITPDKAMRDEQFGERLWNELMVLTGLNIKNNKSTLLVCNLMLIESHGVYSNLLLVVKAKPKCSTS
jgi:hypothetical protein